jgi:hypothetical protein
MAAATVPPADDPEVAALLYERAGYVRAGKTDRVAAVDEQLRLRGYEATGRHRAPAGRRRPSREQAQ